MVVGGVVRGAGRLWRCPTDNEPSNDEHKNTIGDPGTENVADTEDPEADHQTR
jgi:hypothetical protein